jgi:hypothetical protein
LIPLTGGMPRPFLAAGFSTPSWSPDNAHLVYIGSNEAGDPLYLADRTAADARPVDVRSGGKEAFFRKGVHTHNPVWSPDGRYIYFAHGMEAKGEMDVWRVQSSGESPEQLTHGRRAESPRRATVEYLGHLLVFSGNWERGRELGDRARQLNANHPSWYWALPLLDAYRAGDYQAARALAPKAVMPGQYYSHALFAAVYGQLGDLETAREEVRQVLALRPDFAEIAREQFGRWYLPDLVERLIDGLRKAGLDVPPAG